MEELRGERVELARLHELADDIRQRRQQKGSDEESQDRFEGDARQGLLLEHLPAYIYIALVPELYLTCGGNFFSSFSIALFRFFWFFSGLSLGFTVLVAVPRHTSRRAAASYISRSSVPI